MNRDEFIQLSVEYAAGALHGDELTAFEEYLRTAAPQELNELAELVETTSLFPMALDQVTPPPYVRERLLQKIRSSLRAREAVEELSREFSGAKPPSNAPGWKSWMPIGVTFVALAMIVAFAWYVNNLLTTIEKQDRRLVELQNELTRKEELLNVLAAQHVEMVVMRGTPHYPVAYGKIIWDPEKRIAILQVANLPPVPSDKDYQLWVIKSAEGGLPISAGVFAVSSGGSFYFKIEQLAVTDPGEIAAFAVTLEPRGGVPAPTGAMYVAGSPGL